MLTLVLVLALSLAGVLAAGGAPGPVMPGPAPGPERPAGPPGRGPAPIALEALGVARSPGALGPAGVARSPGALPMTIARLQYEGGGDWYVGPSTLPNLLEEIRERTGVPVAPQPATVRLTDAALWDYPFLFISGHGNIALRDEEVAILRRYLLSGGFLLADDCYGMDESFRREMRKVFPDREMVELPRDHPIYRGFYEMPEGLPKIHEHDNQPPQGFGIFHDGRLVMFYAYESDIHDGWEDEHVHNDPPEIREQAFRMGVNIFAYAVAQLVP